MESDCLVSLAKNALLCPYLIEFSFLAIAGVKS